MIASKRTIAAMGALTIGFAGCGGSGEGKADFGYANLLNKYATVRLTADVDQLTRAERAMIPLLIEAARHMDAAFWEQAYGERRALLRAVDDPAARRFVEINYGPWDRLDDDAPFIDGVGPKPAGANFYPADMTKEEFERAAAKDESLRSLYTRVRRRPDGSLEAVAFHEVYAPHVQAAADKLRSAAELAEAPGLKRYLRLRADALLSDDYRASDLAWMEMRDNTIDIVIGPIETYEDQLFGYKAAFEALLLIKDREWSRRLARYASFLPDLQRGLPVADEYKREMPGGEGELNAYDVVYYAGHANAGSKSIAVNLPNDEGVQLEKGTRRLQLKNAMRAKFDRILVPIAEQLIAEDQRRHISFEAFFGNTMFHEVAHGLGIKNTITGKGTVRQALKDHASAMEEGKADVLGLYMVTRLFDEELERGDLRDNYVTFLASIFRSVRFGASSAHGKANMVRFNYFKEKGAFSRDQATGTYRVEFQKMREAMESLSRLILTIQGDGDYDAAAALISSRGIIGPTLQADLERLATLGIPVDIAFEQGLHILGIE